MKPTSENVANSIFEQGKPVEQSELLVRIGLTVSQQAFKNMERLQELVGCHDIGEALGKAVAFYLAKKDLLVTSPAKSAVQAKAKSKIKSKIVNLTEKRASTEESVKSSSPQPSSLTRDSTESSSIPPQAVESASLAYPVTESAGILSPSINSSGLPPQPPAAAKRKPRPYIAKSVRQAVYTRDQGQCSFVSVSGERCVSRHHLEFDHRIPWAQGGGDTIENLVLMCAQHNLYRAREVFGSDFIDAKIAKARAAAPI